MDLTQDTVADASHIRSGFTGHLNDGTSATGSYSGTSPTLTTKSITANGTYNASSDNADGYSSVTVNVSGGGSSSKSGTYTPTQTYSSTTNVKIVDISAIGFTPTKFYLWVDKVSDLSQTRYAITRTSYESFGSTPEHVKLSTRYTNTTGTLGTANNSNPWTTQSDGYLYTDGTSVYFRAHSSYRLLANVKYDWIAEA